MQESPAGVLVAGQQNNETAQKDFEKLVTLVSHGEVKGVVFPQPPEAEGEAKAAPGSVRRGALRGALGGFLIGLIPLTASTVMGAGAGMFIAKAFQLRVERGTAPRIRFAKNGG